MPSQPAWFHRLDEILGRVSNPRPRVETFAGSTSQTQSNATSSAHSAIALPSGVDSVDHNPLNMGLWVRENDH